jgi:hypothetical protein
MADVVSAIGASDIDTSDGSVVEKLFGGSSAESSVDNPMSSKNQEVGMPLPVIIPAASVRSLDEGRHESETSSCMSNSTHAMYAPLLPARYHPIRVSEVVSSQWKFVVLFF